MLIQDDDLSEENRWGLMLMLMVYMMVLYVIKVLYSVSREIKYEYNSEKKNVYI